jgi:hypothetical protein
MQMQMQRPSASRSFNPTMVLDVIPRLMNTMVVLLADGGVQEAEQALHGYCQLHRLFAACVVEYPTLKREIHRRLRAFIESSQARDKLSCPNLGEMFPLLSVCEEVGWLDMVCAMMQESFARSVLWLCRDVPKLAALATSPAVVGAAPAPAPAPAPASVRGSGSAGGGRGGGYSGYSSHAQGCRLEENDFDLGLLDEIKDASTTRHRLFVFNVCFLRLVCSSRGADLSAITRKYDLTLGIPPRHMKQRLLQMLHEAEEANTWPEFFDVVCLARVSMERLRKMWIESLRLSHLRGYHTLGTDFGRIQSKGVSSILLRGKSFPRVVFCIDCSGSMSSEFYDPESKRSLPRLEYVKEELHRIFREKLSHRNQFSLIQFNHTADVWSRGLQQATPTNLQAAAQYVSSWMPSGGTDFSVALHHAFAVPDVQAVYLLSDGEVGGDIQGLLDQVRGLSRNGEIQCHTTAFFAPASGQGLLEAIASGTKGTYLKFGEASY